MTPSDIRSIFYDRLAAAVSAGMPTSKSISAGVAWRSGVDGVYHRALVLPYVGDFEHPERRGLRPWTAFGLPIPRIHVNHYDSRVSQAQKRRWAGAGCKGEAWWPSRHVLELTVDLEELLDFASWVAAWTRAVEANDLTLLPALPHPLQHDRAPEELLRTAYEWTTRAAQDYERRWQRYERPHRAETGANLRRAGLPGDDRYQPSRRGKEADDGLEG